MARHHPDFLAAKQGDFDAAIRLVDDLVKDEKVIDVATRFPEAHVAYIHRQNGTGINMIPAAFAAKFSAAGMTVEDDIIAITNVSHTDASDVARLSRRMRFEGNVTKGASYIILDDFITSGAELRDMRDYISSKGAGCYVLMLRVRDKGGRNSGEEPVEYRPKSIAISPRPRCTMTVIPKPWHRNNCSLSSAGLLYKPITNVFVESVPIAVTND